jgi:hypothetical protein
MGSVPLFGKSVNPLDKRAEGRHIVPGDADAARGSTVPIPRILVATTGGILFAAYP